MKKLLLSLLLVLVVLATAVPCMASVWDYIREAWDTEHDWRFRIQTSSGNSIDKPSLYLEAEELRSEKNSYQSIQIVVTAEGEGHFNCDHNFVEIGSRPAISSPDTWKYICKRCAAMRFLFTFQETGSRGTQRKAVILPRTRNFNKGRIVVEAASQGLILGTMGVAEFTITNGIVEYGKF